jgi:UPF0755 protein
MHDARKALLWGLLLAALLGSLTYQGARWLTEPAAGETADHPVRLIEIPAGATFRQVATLLKNEQLIAHYWAFRLLGKLESADRRIIPGEYAFHPGMRPTDILSDLVNGRVVLHAVTIPEGHTASQIAELLAQRGIADQAELLRLIRDREFIRSLDIEAASLEGYLFPNTYRFARHTDPKETLRTLVMGLRQSVTPDLAQRARELNLSLHQVLTLASVIEKETGVGAERELVSAVFHNRLRRRLPLQSDPTVIYGLARFDGNLKARDLALESPYNTYRIVGLPPGPIASPGLQAIRAALYPAHTNHLYFVSRNDGSHYFSATLEEHNRAVDKYQKRNGRLAKSKS